MAGPPAPWLEAQAGDQEGLGLKQAVGKSGRGCLGEARPRLAGGKLVQWTNLRAERSRTLARAGRRVYRACPGAGRRGPICRGTNRGKRWWGEREWGKPRHTLAATFWGHESGTRCLVTQETCDTLSRK